MRLVKALLIAGSLATFVQPALADWGDSWFNVPASRAHQGARFNWSTVTTEVGGTGGGGSPPSGLNGQVADNFVSGGIHTYSTDCPAPPAAPSGTAKVWYFDAGVGHTASYYASNPVTAPAYAGDALHPYDNPQALGAPVTGYSSALLAYAVWNHGGATRSDLQAIGNNMLNITVSDATTITGGAVVTDPSGNKYEIVRTLTFSGAGSVTNNDTLYSLQPGAAYNLPIGTTMTPVSGITGPGAATISIVTSAAMSSGASLATFDPNHTRIWPGDEIILAGTTQFPATTVAGLASNPIYNLNPDGTQAYLWFKGDGTNRPNISGLTFTGISGVIATGISVDNTNPLGLWTGTSTISTGVTFPNAPVSGDTLTINGETWTYSTTASTNTTTHVIGIGSSATVSSSYTATIAALQAASTGGDVAAQGWTTYSVNGFGALTFTTTGFNSAGPIPSFATSVVQTVTTANVSIGLPIYTISNAALKVTGTATLPAAYIYMDDIDIDAGQVNGTRRQIDDYPMTGSLGISEITGHVVPANVGGPWNATDWLYQTRTGLDIAGGTTGVNTNADTAITGLNCVTFSNGFVKKGTDNVVVANATRVLISNTTSDYAGVDNFVSGGSNYTKWIGNTVRNTVDNGGGFHPDGWQGQSSITWTGENGWHDVWIDRYSLLPVSDATLVSKSWTDFNSVVRTLAGEPTGIQTTVTAINKMSVTNSRIFSHNGPNLSLGVGHELTIANNTVLWDGDPTTSPQLGKIAVNGTQPSGAVPPWNIEVTNNVANSYTRDSAVGKACNVGISFHNNYMVAAYYNGSQTTTSPFSVYCTTDASGNTVSGNPAQASTTDDGGITWLPSTSLSTIFTDFAPAGNGSSSTVLDATLKSGSPLKGAGTASNGATTTDFNGTTRGAPPSVGAYE